MMAAYFCAMSYLVQSRFYSYETHAFDLGIFNQAFSTALKGMLFYETPDQHLIPTGSFLGVHFNLLMFLLLPIYAIFPSAQALLILQTVVVALGAVPIYLVARRVLVDARLSLLMSLIYLINPATLNLNLYDFHLEAFIPFFVGMLYYSYVVSNWRWYALFLALSLITIDFAPIVVVAVCLAHLLKTLSRGNGRRHRVWFDIDRRRATILFGTTVISLATFYISIQASAILGGKTASVGGILSGFVAPVLYGPTLVLKSEFWMLPLICLMFLPLLTPSQLVMVAPWFLVTLLEGSYATSYSFGYQYAGAFVFPFLLLATIYSFAKLRRHRISARGFVAAMILFSLLIVPFTPLTDHRISGLAYTEGYPTVTPHDDILTSSLAYIPANASILTQNNLFPQVSGRADAYLYILDNKSAIQYVWADSTSPTFIEQTMPGQSMKTLLPKFISSGDYGVVVDDDGVVLLERGYAGPVLLSGPTTYVFNYQTLALKAGVEETDSTSVSGVVLVHPPSEPSGSIFWFGPYVSLLPGAYNVTYVLKSTPATNGSILLQVDNFVNSTSVPILAVLKITPHSFPQTDSWVKFNLTIDYSPYESAVGRLEFRGADAIGGPFSLDYIEVTYIGPYNP